VIESYWCLVAVSRFFLALQPLLLRRRDLRGSENNRQVFLARFLRHPFAEKTDPPGPWVITASNLQGQSLKSARSRHRPERAGATADRKSRRFAFGNLPSQFKEAKPGKSRLLQIRARGLARSCHRGGQEPPSKSASGKTAVPISRPSATSPPERFRPWPAAGGEGLTHGRMGRHADDRRFRFGVTIAAKRKVTSWPLDPDPHARQPSPPSSAGRDRPGGRRRPSGSAVRPHGAAPTRSGRYIAFLISR